ncbi:hypothetical protein ACFQU7_00865 [Pseudoroseomonas wenyumeiae]
MTVFAVREQVAARQTARDPAGAARRELDVREREARVVLASPPNAEAVQAKAAAVLARAAQRRDVAARAAEEARQAVRRHAKENSLTGLGWIVIGRRAVAEQRRLAAVAQAAERRAQLARGDYAEEVAAVALALERAALAVDEARQAWMRGPAAAAADELSKVQEERRSLAINMDTCHRVPADPRTAAVLRLADAERQYTADPVALARARVVTAAAVAGDPATVAAAAVGDLAAAQRAAHTWQERQQRGRKRAEACRNAPCCA